MPIRPENRARYPKDWPAVSARIRGRAGNCCEECGVENGALGGREPGGVWHDAIPTGDNGLRLTWPKPGEYGWCKGFNTHRLRIIRIVLTVAHLNHTPEDCRDENLRALCQRCHLRYDAAEKARGRKAETARHGRDSECLARGSSKGSRKR